MKQSKFFKAAKIAVVVLIVCRVISGVGFEKFCVFFSAVFIHELSHLICAGFLGKKAVFSGVGLFGFRIDMYSSASVSERFLIYSGGIAGNLFLASLALLWKVKWGIPVGLFAEYNILMAIVNLMPAYPLDGGRILEVVLTYFFGRLASVKAVAVTGILIGSAMFVFGLNLFMFYTDNLILPVMGIFLIYSSDKELTSVRTEYVRNLLSGIS